MKDKKTKKIDKPATKKAAAIKDLPPARDPKGGRGGWDRNHNVAVA